MHRRTITSILLAAALTVLPRVAVAGNIVTDSSYARLYDTNSLIHFGLSSGNVTVTDSEITGYAWSEDWGWINLQPTQSGVKNDGEGNLLGFAWGETLGWINFSPTQGGVSISEEGYFIGYAWAENGGWVVFSCETDDSCGNVDHRVQTTWSPDSDDAGSGAGGSFAGGGGDETPTPSDVSLEDLVESPAVDSSDTDNDVDGGAPEESEEASLVPESVSPEEETGDLSEGGGAADSPSSEEPQSRGGGDSTVEKVALYVMKNVGGAVKAVQESVENIQNATRAFLLDSPERATTVKTASGVVAGVGTVVAGATLFATPVALAEIVFLPARIVSLILALFGYKRKRYPWGTVYDSVTKQPLDPAYVKLIPRLGG